MSDGHAWNDDMPDEGRKRLQEAQELHRAKLEGVVRKLAKTPDGQYFLRWLVRGTGVFQANYPADHVRAAFDAGQRAVGLSIVTLCAAVGAGNIIINNDEVNNG